MNKHLPHIVTDYEYKRGTIFDRWMDRGQELICMANHCFIYPYTEKAIQCDKLSYYYQDVKQIRCYPLGTSPHDFHQNSKAVSLKLRGHQYWLLIEDNLFKKYNLNLGLNIFEGFNFNLTIFDLEKYEGEYLEEFKKQLIPELQYYSLEFVYE